MAFAWFNLGVRFVGSQFTDGLRRAGEQFHSTVGGMDRDVARLTREVHKLEKAERAALEARNTAKKAHDSNVAAAKSRLDGERKIVTALRDEIRKVQADKLVGADKTSPEWKAWKARYDAALRTNKMAADQAAIDRAHSKATLDNARLTSAVRLEGYKKERALQEKVLAERQAKVAEIRARPITGDAARNPGHQAWIAQISALDTKLGQLRQDRAERGSAAQLAGQRVRGTREDLIAKLAAIPTKSGTLGRRDARVIVRDLIERGGDLGPLRAHIGPEADAHARALATQAGLRGEIGALTRELEGGSAARREIAAAAPDKSSAAVLAHADELRRAEAARSRAQRRLDIVSANLREVEAEESVRKLEAENAHANKSVAIRKKVLAAKQAVLNLFAEEPVKDVGDGSASTLQRLRKKLVSAILGVRIAGDSLAREKLDKSDLNVKELELEEARRAAQVKRDERTAAAELARENRMLATEQRNVRTMLRQHVMGSLFDAAMQFQAVRSAFSGISRLAQRGAEFQYKAQGISTLEGAASGTGQDVFATYSRLGRYQSEVLPLEAIGRLGDLSAAGYTRGEMPDAAASIFDTLLAARGEITTSGAFDLGVSLDRAFGGGGKTMRDSLDTAVRAANIFPMTVGKIRDMMGYATEAAVQYQQPLEEIMMLGGMMMPINKTASKTGTGIRNMLTSLVKPKTQKWLQAQGINVIGDNGQMKLAGDIYLEITQKLDEIEARDGKAKRQAIEYVLTGQRGGSAFAMFQRATSGTASAALRGTPFEGMRFESAKDAIEAMRLAIADSTGETRRMADEMRKTSFVLDLSFKASLERASIAAGTLILPIRDSMQQVGKTVLDWFTSMAGGGYDTPGSRAAGSSFGGALGGIALTAAGAWGTAGAASTLWGAVRNISDLARPSRIAAIAEEMRTGTDLASAITATRNLDTFGAKIARIASWEIPMLGTSLGGLLKGLGLIGFALGGFMLALESSRKAITDYTAQSERAISARQNRARGVLQALFEAQSEDKIRFNADGTAILPKSTEKATRAGGALTGTALAMLAAGETPQAIVEAEKRQLRGEITRYFTDKSGKIRDEEKYREQLKLFDEGWQDWEATAGKDLYEKMGYSMYGEKMAKRMGFSPDEYKKWLKAQSLKYDLNPFGESAGWGLERGGPRAMMVADALRSTDSKDIHEALGKMSPLDRSLFVSRISAADVEETGGGWFKQSAIGAGGFLGGLALEVLGEGGKSPGSLAMMMPRLADVPTRRDQFTDDWQYVRPDLGTVNLGAVLSTNVTATDRLNETMGKLADIGERQLANGGRAPSTTEMAAATFKALASALMPSPTRAVVPTGMARGTL